jgi:adenylate kinase family enzyme
LDAPEEILVKRLLHRGQHGGRSDDNEETIRKRIHTFNDATRPVVAYYEAKGKLARVRIVCFLFA